MARPRSEKFEDIKREILDKAARVFAEKGYERSSINDLIEACSLSRGALYHYFQSKEAILFALLDTHVKGLLKRLEEAGDELGTPKDRLARAVETIVLYNAGSVNEQVTLLNDLDSLSESEQQIIVKLERKIVSLIADLLVDVDKAGRISGKTKTAYAMMLFGLINYAYTWYDPTKSISPIEMARMAVDIFLNGFLSPQRAPSGVRGTRPTEIGARTRVAMR